MKRLLAVSALLCVSQEDACEDLAHRADLVDRVCARSLAFAEGDLAVASDPGLLSLQHADHHSHRQSIIDQGLGHGVDARGQAWVTGDFGFPRG